MADATRSVDSQGRAGSMGELEGPSSRLSRPEKADGSPRRLLAERVGALRGDSQAHERRPTPGQRAPARRTAGRASL